MPGGTNAPATPIYINTILKTPMGVCNVIHKMEMEMGEMKNNFALL